MSCGFSKEILALHAGGDLPEGQLKRISGHLPICEDCRQFLEQLRTTQTLLKSLRSEKLSPSDCVPMRREVMSLINEGRDGSGWPLRIERAIMLGFWRRSYSLAAFAVFMIISISGLAQMRQTDAGHVEVCGGFRPREHAVPPGGLSKLDPRGTVVSAPI